MSDVSSDFYKRLECDGGFTLSRGHCMVPGSDQSLRGAQVGQPHRSSNSKGRFKLGCRLQGNLGGYLAMIRISAPSWRASTAAWTLEQASWWLTTFFPAVYPQRFGETCNPSSTEQTMTAGSSSNLIFDHYTCSAMPWADVVKAVTRCDKSKNTSRIHVLFF